LNTSSPKVLGGSKKELFRWRAKITRRRSFLKRLARRSLPLCVGYAHGSHRDSAAVQGKSEEKVQPEDASTAADDDAGEEEGEEEEEEKPKKRAKKASPKHADKSEDKGEEAETKSPAKKSTARPKEEKKEEKKEQAPAERAQFLRWTSFTLVMPISAHLGVVCGWVGGWVAGRGGGGGSSCFGLKG
jgi:hypothetical protein